MQDYLINRTQGFTIVSQSVTRNKDLSLKERGLILTLLSLPDGWHLSVRGLAELMPDGVDGVQSCLKKIEEKGYLRRTRHNDESTGYFYWTWEIFAEPSLENIKEDDHKVVEIQKQKKLPNEKSLKRKVKSNVSEFEKLKTKKNSISKPHTENPDMVHPDREEPHTENPDMVNPYTENPALLNTNKLTMNKLNTNNPLPPVRKSKVEKEEEDFTHIVQSEYNKRLSPDAALVRHVLLQEAYDDQKSSLSVLDRIKLKRLTLNEIRHIYYVYCDKKHNTSINMPEKYIRRVIKGVLDDGYKDSTEKGRDTTPQNEYVNFAERIARVEREFFQKHKE